MSQNQNNSGQNIRIKELETGEVIVDESTTQQKILVDGILLLDKNPDYNNQCKEILIFFTLDDRIKLNKFKNCGKEKFLTSGKSFELIL